ncbi:MULTISPECIES: hypothetical protein [Sphingobacterium]|uniref:hypothetical protein n=1 Tax=Sphingobacterium TaxID=28453 RepID=UPI00257CF7BC|nr:MULTISPECIES: hypothetical protein [Sphingobacterium]
MDTIHYRSRVHLLIERTLNGLDYDYISSGLNQNELERLQLSFDERNQVGQFNEGYCYSVKRTAQHLIYSVINTSMKDNAKRNGFLAVRLIVKHNEHITSVMQYLLQITTQYINHIKDSSLNNQNYDLILDEAAKSIKQNNSINPKITPDKTIFYQFLNLSLDQSEAFNNPKLVYATKVYFLDEQSLHNEAVAKQFGFQPVEDLFAQVRKITFNNTTTNGLRLKINEEEERSLLKDQFLICMKGDRIQYKLTFDTRYKEVSIFEGEIEVRPEEPRPPRPSNQEPERSSSGLVWAWIIGPILGIAIGYWGIEFAMNLVGIGQKAEVNVAVEIVKPVENFSFKIDTAKSRVLYLEFADSTLQNYVFSYKGKAEGWKFYKKGEEKNAKALTKSELRSIFQDEDRVLNFCDQLTSQIASDIPEDNPATTKSRPIDSEEITADKNNKSQPEKPEKRSSQPAKGGTKSHESKV